MFDIKAAEAEALKEVQDEKNRAMKAKIKAHLGRISAAQDVLSNLQREYRVMIAELGSE